MKNLLLLLLLSLTLISCSSSKSVRNTSTFNLFEFSNQTILPIKSFVKLDSIVNIETEAGEGLAKFSSASGFFVKENKILTAAHFCNSLDAKMFFIKQGAIVNNVYYEITSFDGHKMEAIVINKDEDNDLCLMLVIGPTHEIDKQVIKMSDEKPHVGQRVYNIAAPLGIFAPGMVPIFEGFHSGPALYPGKTEDVKVDIYSLPIKQGSSGSPIVNDRYELVGVVIAGVRRFNNVGFSPRYEIIKQFLEVL